jgi:hypothetical protein
MDSKLTPTQARSMLLVAIATVALLVIVVLVAKVLATRLGGISGSQSTSTSVQHVVYPERFEVPTETNIKRRLTYRTWNALITTFKSAGIITDYDQVSGVATFSYDNSTNIRMELDWKLNSQTYVLYGWELNAALDGYTAKWVNSSGDEYRAVIVPRTGSENRIDISIYDSGNALKRLVVLTT